MNTRLKAFRKELGLSQAQFAKRLGMSQNHFSYLESGKRTITKRLAKDLEKEFNLNSFWLMTGEGEMCLDPLEQLDIKDPEVKEFMEMYLDADDETRALIKGFLKKALHK